MTNELQIMNVEGIECYEKDGIAYLKLDTVARGLGFIQTQTKNGTEYTSIRWETVFRYLEEIGFPNKLGKNDFIPESAFYQLAMKAKNDTAKAFQAKIANEVLPSIRKHGMYATSDIIHKMIASPEFGIKLLTTLKEEHERNASLQNENNKLQMQLDQSKEWYSIKRVASLNGCSWKRFDWRILKRESIEQGYEVRKIFDANYGEINTYHMKVWEAVYPEMEL